MKLISRNSILARIQTEMFAKSMKNLDSSIDVSILFTETLGDKYRECWEDYLSSNPNSNAINKKKWTFDLEESIISGDADIAVHSGKDLPYQVRQGTTLIPILDRADPRDVVIVRSDAEMVEGFKEGYNYLEFVTSLRENREKSFVFGTGSLRRQVQLKRIASNIKTIDYNGNINTRIEKFKKDSELFGIVLAAAGLIRCRGSINTEGIVVLPFERSKFMPAVNQGTLVAQCRTRDSKVIELLSSFTHKDVFSCWKTERACSSRLEATCDTALGLFAETVEGGRSINFTAKAFSRDGTLMMEDFENGLVENAKTIGTKVAERLIARGVKEILNT